MPVQSARNRGSASLRQTPPPPSLPDLFGFVPPARPTTTSPPRPAEWPAVPLASPSASMPADRTARRPARPAAAPRPASTGPASAPLSGTYDRTGANLRRADGRALVVCLSTKPPTASRPGRYVRTVAPAEAIRYAGSLYPARVPTPDDDLDGCHFQDAADGIRYAIRRTAPDRYAVAPVSRGSRRRASVTT